MRAARNVLGDWTVTRPHDIEERAFRFACGIAQLCEHLMTRGAVVRRLSSQLLDAGSSVGANLEEAVAAQTRPDFVSKCSVAHKEAREARYWLRLISTVDRTTAERIGPHAGEAGELIAILKSIVENAKSHRT